LRKKSLTIFKNEHITIWLSSQQFTSWHVSEPKQLVMPSAKLIAIKPANNRRRHLTLGNSLCQTLCSQHELF
jgi:hypothetical protein